MSRATGPANIGDVLASTYDAVQPEVVDNIYNGITFYRLMKQKGNIKEQMGGEQLTGKILYAKNSTFKFMSKTGVIDTTPQEQVTDYAFPWAYAYGSMALYDADLDNNRGEAQIFSLIEMNRKNLELTGMAQLNSALFASSTATNYPTALVTLIGTGTVGGIAGATYSYWQSTTSTTASWASTGVTDLRTNFLTVRKGIDAPQLLITSNTVYGYIENSEEGKQRYTDNGKWDPGCDSLSYKGAIIVPDADCGSYIYGLNLNYLEVKVNSGREFYFDPEPIRSINQAARVWRVKWQGNLLTNNRRMHFCQTITAA